MTKIIEVEGLTKVFPPSAKAVDGISFSVEDGEVITSRGTKAKATIVGRGSRVSGPLVGDEIDVGKEIDIGDGIWGQLSRGRWSTIGQMTRVDDVYGKVVKIWRYSRAKNVYAESLELGAGAMVDKIAYTRELKSPSSYRIEGQATRTTRLPDPPL